MLRSAVQSRLLRGENFVYAVAMASDRMMQAIGALERAVSRLEKNVETLAAAPAPASSGVDHAAARAALRSLDELIADMKGSAHG